MAEYLLLLRGGDGPRRAGEEVSPAEMEAYLTPYRDWLAELSRDGGCSPPDGWTPRGPRRSGAWMARSP